MLSIHTMGLPSPNTDVVSVEFFASSDPDGSITGVMMAVPCRRGLREADTLRLDRKIMTAMRGTSVLPIDLPDLEDRDRKMLVSLVRAGQDLAVGEFTARGLLDSYFLTLNIVEAR